MFPDRSKTLPSVVWVSPWMRRTFSLGTFIFPDFEHILIDDVKVKHWRLADLIDDRRVFEVFLQTSTLWMIPPSVQMNQPLPQRPVSPLPGNTHSPSVCRPQEAVILPQSPVVPVQWAAVGHTRPPLLHRNSRILGSIQTFNLHIASPLSGWTHLLRPTQQVSWSVQVPVSVGRCSLGSSPSFSGLAVHEC